MAKTKKILIALEENETTKVVHTFIRGMKVEEALGVIQISQRDILSANVSPTQIHKK